MKTNQMVVRKKVALGLLLFALAIVSKGFVDALFVNENANGPLNFLKYFFLLGAAGLFADNSTKKKRIFVDEFRTLLFLYVCIAVITVFFVLKNGRFSFRTIKEFCFILPPIIFVYYAINVLDENVILFMAKFSAIIYFISYFIEIADNFSFSMAAKAITNFSLAGGQASFAYDYYESSHFPDPMMALLCYFCYHKEENKKWIWLTYISILLMNKRLIILFATILVVFSYLPFWDKMIHKTIEKKIAWLPSVFFSFSPLLVMSLTTSAVGLWVSIKFGINMADFWMGRDNMVKYYLSSGFKSYGLGSTYDFAGKLLEIESIKFYLETTILGSILLSFSYWQITKRNLYSMLVMTYIFLNMNTSTSLTTGAFAWIYYLFLIGGINSETTHIDNSTSIQCGKVLR